MHCEGFIQCWGQRTRLVAFPLHMHTWQLHVFGYLVRTQWCYSRSGIYTRIQFRYLLSLVKTVYLHVAGPLALAKESLEVDSEPFFVLNSDVICNYPFEEMLKFHKAHGKEGTIVVRILWKLSQILICTLMKRDTYTYMYRYMSVVVYSATSIIRPRSIIQYLDCWDLLETSIHTSTHAQIPNDLLGCGDH